MKKKFDLKLTAFLVSLFIGLLIVILGNKNPYLLSFGFIVIGFSLALFAMFKTADINAVVNELQVELESLKPEDEFRVKEIAKAQAKLTSQRRKVNFVFYVAATLLIVLAFVNIL